MSFRTRPHEALSCRRRTVNLALAAATLGLFFGRRASAQTARIPVGLQASLIVKIAAFDRNFAERAGSQAVVLLVAMQDDAESMRAALEMKSALSQASQIGEVPHQEEIVTFTNATALADLVRNRKAAIVYFGSRLRQADGLDQGDLLVAQCAHGGRGSGVRAVGGGAGVRSRIGTAEALGELGSSQRAAGRIPRVGAQRDESYDVIQSMRSRFRWAKLCERGSSS